MSLDASFFAAVTIGFLGGVHCLGMCGGIISAMTLSAVDKSKKHTFKLNLSYNLGRILSYVVAGAIAGGIGLLLIKTGGGKNIQIVLRIIAYLFMIVLGLYLSGIWNGLTYTEKFGQKIWRKIQPWAHKFYPFQTVRQGLIAGFLWGWIPCGMVYSILAWSVASSTPTSGAWLMFGFGLGTLPNLLAIGLFAQKLKPIIQNNKVKLIAGLIISLYGALQLYMFITKIPHLNHMMSMNHH